METPKIDLNVGTPLVLEIKKDLNRIKSSYIGMEYKKYVIIKIDKSHAVEHLHKLLFKGHPVKIRYIDKGKVYGFVSAIFYIIYNPDKLIFITYPDNIEEQNVRAQKRVECFFPARVSFKEAEYEGVVVDISKNGCRFTTSADDASDNLFPEKPLNDFTSMCSSFPEGINLKLKLPGSKRKINIVCKQRSLSKDNNCASLGLEFISLTEKDSILFYDYLLDMNAIPISFNIPLAVIKHMVWMNEFKSFLNGNKNISKKELVSGRESELGKWLYAEGIQIYRHIDEMAELEKIHEGLHRFVLDIVKETPERYTQEQKEALISRIDTISQEIIMLLNKIENKVEKKTA